MKKISNPCSILVLILFTALTSAAQEDILLIDVNNVVPEIDQVQKFIDSEKLSGREKNTRLVIVPSLERLSMENRRKIHSLHETQIDANQNYYETQCTDSQMQSSPQRSNICNQKLAEMKSARNKVAQLLSMGDPSAQSDKLSIDDVLVDLEAALRGPYKFNRVIISGHHFPGDTSDDRRLISGELFTGFSTEIAQKYLNSAPSALDVRSVMLFGCWTGGVEALVNYWSQVLPKANLHSGFISTAPIKTSPENLNILNSFLKNEKTLGESKSKPEAQKNLSLLYKGNRQLGFLINSWYLKK